MTLNTSLDFAARRAKTVLCVGGRARDLVPGVADGFGDAMGSSLRLMLHQLAHRFGETRDVLAQGSQIRSGSAFSVLGHSNLQHERNDGRVVLADWERGIPLLSVPMAGSRRNNMRVE